MRTINATDITELIEKLCIEANCVITEDIKTCLGSCMKSESSPLGREILGTLVDNAEIAASEMSPICQDTGMTVVFVTMGQDLKS